MTLNDFSRSTPLLACLSLVCACSRTAPAQDPARDIETARHSAEAVHATLSALPPACALGTAALAPQGSWLNAPKAMPEPGRPSTFVELFDTTVTAGAVRAGLNRAALAALDKVEIRDAEGKWAELAPVGVHQAPAGCDYVWLQQDLGGARRVTALRYTFRRSVEPVTLADAAIFTSD